MFDNDKVEIEGVGFVDIPSEISDPSERLGELHCRNVPSARKNFQSVYFEQVKSRSTL